MGYEAICDCCGNHLPVGEFLVSFWIGSTNVQGYENRWGEVCDKCYELLHRELRVSAKEISNARIQSRIGTIPAVLRQTNAANKQNTDVS